MHIENTNIVKFCPSSYTYDCVIGKLVEFVFMKSVLLIKENHNFPNISYSFKAIEVKQKCRAASGSCVFGPCQCVRINGRVSVCEDISILVFLHFSYFSVSFF